MMDVFGTFRSRPGRADLAVDFCRPESIRETLLQALPVFVVGVFRSGTTLLCALLNQNPKISLMHECDVWNFPRPLLKLRFEHNWPERLEFYNNALSRHRMITPDDQRALKKIRIPLDLYRTFGEKKGAVVNGEKSPFYCNRLEQLHKRYPKASFICLWRNPAEVYRSVLKAGQTCRYFRKWGMLSRMIYLQEQAIRQAGRIEEKGARVFRLDYADIMDQTEKVCRDLSAFLGVPFDPRMLQLGKADFAAIDKAPHHAHLRRGIIERQTYTEELVSPRLAAKLERYRRRWEEQQGQRPNPAANTHPSAPGPVEFVYHNALGRALVFYDSLVRAGFEFLPLPWLRIYRRLKGRVVNPPSAASDKRTSLCQVEKPKA
jgi:hypothetical protein